MITETMRLSDIRRKYRDGVGLLTLAQLNACSTQEIREIVAGIEPAKKPKPVKPKAVIDRSQWPAWHAEGLTPEQIAMKSGCTQKPVRDWLKSQNLAPNRLKQRDPFSAWARHEASVKPVQQKEGKRMPIDKSEWMQWYEEGLTVLEMSSRAGCSITPVRKWHEKNELTPNRKEPVKHESLNGDPTAKPEPKPEPTEPLEIPQVLKAPPSRPESTLKQLTEEEAVTLHIALEPQVLDALEAETEIADSWQDGDLKLELTGPRQLTLNLPETMTPPTPRADWQALRRAELADWIAYCVVRQLPIDSAFIQEWNEGVSVQ